MWAPCCIVSLKCAVFERVLSCPFSVLLNFVAHIVAKEVTVMLCINCYIVWKINVARRFESQNILAVIFWDLQESCCTDINIYLHGPSLFHKKYDDAKLTTLGVSRSVLALICTREFLCLPDIECHAAEMGGGARLPRGKQISPD
jgi:hypothetical protein